MSFKTTQLSTFSVTWPRFIQSFSLNIHVHFEIRISQHNTVKESRPSTVFTSAHPCTWDNNCCSQSMLWCHYRESCCWYRPNPPKAKRWCCLQLLNWLFPLLWWLSQTLNELPPICTVVCRVVIIFIFIYYLYLFSVPALLVFNILCKWKYSLLISQQIIQKKYNSIKSKILIL